MNGINAVVARRVNGMYNARDYKALYGYVKYLQAIATADAAHQANYAQAALDVMRGGVWGPRPVELDADDRAYEALLAYEAECGENWLDEVETYGEAAEEVAEEAAAAIKAAEAIFEAATADAV